MIKNTTGRTEKSPKSLKKNTDYKHKGNTALCTAAQQALERYPYFRVRFDEQQGDFYTSENDLPSKVTEGGLVPLGGEQNNYYLIGVTHHGRNIDVSFHHGLTDGRGIKSFVETLIYYYCKQAFDSCADSEGILTNDTDIDISETAEPFDEKYKVDKTKLDRIEGVSRKGFTLPETKAPKSSHRRYEIKFPQKAFIDLCKQNGASPVIMLSVMMSRAIKELYPDCDETINSNFPVDARAALGVNGTYKNCVKSISLPFSSKEQAMSTEELCRYYKELMNKQRDPERCKDEFNKIIMLLNMISHLHSFKKKRMIMRFLDDLKLDTYLISYIGQFDLNENERFVDSVHLFSDCSDGLVMNMTCQCGFFCIDFVQDFEGDKYINALAKQLENAGLPLSVSEEIVFSTPHDMLMTDMPAHEGVAQQSFIDKTIGANIAAYKLIEHGTVSCYKTIENGFVRAFLAKKGETVDDAKLRLADEQIERLNTKISKLKELSHAA
ncbi:MAG: hypothetical protein IJ740_16225 [Ruminococcus sp.]|nr:hypothetical protein [Ruminococcus sp.]